MALKPSFSVSEAFPSCDILTVTDITCQYNATTCKGGYGTPNVAISGVTKTLFYLTPPGSDLEVVINKSFLPTANSCDNNGSFNITCQDYFLALQDVEAQINSNNVSLTTDEPCGCPGEIVETPSSVNTNTLAGCYVDGCWKMRYEVYAAGNTYTWDTLDTFIPDAIRINIDGAFYVLGYVATAFNLVNALNTLGLGIFILSGNTITVTDTHTYGPLSSANTTYNFTGITYGADFKATINGNVYDLGTIANSNALLAALNALNLGTWIFTDANTLTAYGFATYHSMFRVAVEIPVTAFNAHTRIPDEESINILVGSSSRSEFLYGQIASRIKDVGMKTFATPCDCQGESIQDKFYALTQDFSTMLLAVKGNSCNCQCGSQYLVKLQSKCSELENNCL